MPFRVTLARSASEGEAALNRDAFHVVVTDYYLPGRDGSRIARRAYPIPVIMVTGDPSLEPAIAAARASTAGFLHKPISALDLLAEVIVALLQRDLERLRRWMEGG